MDTVDEATGLTPRQKSAIQSSYANLKRDWHVKEYGKDLFTLLFQEYPKTLTYFKHLQGLSMEEIRSSKQLKAHLYNFGTQLTSWIDNLDDAEVLVGLLHRIASSHLRRGIPAEMFDGAFDCLKKLLVEKYSIDDFTAKSWGAACITISSVISAKMKEKA